MLSPKTLSLPLPLLFYLAAICLCSVHCSKQQAAEEEAAPATAAVEKPAVPAAPAKPKTPGVSDTEVVIGVTNPLSGPAAGWGVPITGGMQAWVDELNDKGGIHGRKLKLIIKDDGYNPARALSNLQEMKDQVLAIAGQLGSAPSAACKDFYPENKIPLIHGYANVDIYAKQPKEKQKYYFIAYPDYENENEYFTKYAVEKLKAKKIAHFYQNDDYGMGANAGIKKALAALAGQAELVAEVPYEATERAFNTHALKLKQSQADTVIITTMMSAAALISKELAKIDYKPTVVGNFTVGDPIMFAIAGDAWEGTYVSVPGHIGTPGADEAADKVAAVLTGRNEKLKGKEMLALFGAATIMHLSEGMKNAGKDLTRESLIAGMEKIKDFKPEGMGAPVTYSAERHHGVNSIRPCQAKDKKLNPLGDYVVFAPKF